MAQETQLRKQEDCLRSSKKNLYLSGKPGRQVGSTPLAKRRRQFLKEWTLAPGRCSRGPDRSMTAGKLHDFLQHLGRNRAILQNLEFFFRDRSQPELSLPLVQSHF